MVVQRLKGCNNGSYLVGPLVCATPILDSTSPKPFPQLPKSVKWASVFCAEHTIPVLCACQFPSGYWTPIHGHSYQLHRHSITSLTQTMLGTFGISLSPPFSREEPLESLPPCNVPG